MEGILLTQDRILIQPIHLEEKSAGGIILGDVYASEQTFGLVLGVGPTIINANIVEGATICFSPGEKQVIKILGREYLIMREYDIVYIKQN